MSEMVERVARAMLEDSDFKHWIDWESAARAAISAMREPTDAMVSAGLKLVDWNLGADDAWRAMIDAALPQEGGER